MVPAIVSVEEARNYLRLDNTDDDETLEYMLNTATQFCLDVARVEDGDFVESDLSKAAVLYTLAYLYEHRENADHHKLAITLRSLLFPLRERSMF